MLKFLFAFKIIFLPYLLVLVIPNIGISQNLKDDPEAREVFEELDRRRDTIDFEKSDMTMRIVDSRDRVRQRKMKFFTDNTSEGSKTLIIFADPADIRGTALLTIEQNKQEVQKLYLPALSRVQTISASQKGDRFMGSDFTYEDLGAQSPDDYNFELLTDTDSLITLKAKKKTDSQYAYIKFHIDPDRYVLREAEYFNDDGARIKRLVATNYQEVLDSIWRAGKMVMFDEQNDRHTELTWQNRVVNTPIPSWRFSERGLRRGL